MCLPECTRKTSRKHFDLRLILLLLRILYANRLNRKYVPHSPMENYLSLIEVLEIMVPMLQYINFLSLKTIKVSSDFILNSLKKVVGGATTQKYQKQMLKPWYLLYGSNPRDPRGVKRCARIHWTCHLRFTALILPSDWRIFKKV